MTCGGCKNMPKPYTHTGVVEQPRPVTEANGEANLNKDSNWAQRWRTRLRFVTSTSLNVTTASGLEFEVGNQQMAVAPITIYAPFSSPSRVPMPSDRIRVGLRVFNIIYAARVDESGPEILIKAIERKEPAVEK